IESSFLYGPPDAVETEAQGLLFYPQRHNTQRTDPFLTLLHGLGKSLCPRHEISHIQSLEWKIEVDVDAPLRPAAAVFHSRYRKGGAVCGKDCFGRRVFSHLLEDLSLYFHVFGYRLFNQISVFERITQVRRKPDLLFAFLPLIPRNERIHALCL